MSQSIEHYLIWVFIWKKNEKHNFVWTIVTWWNRLMTVWHPQDKINVPFSWAENSGWISITFSLVDCWLISQFLWTSKTSVTVSSPQDKINATFNLRPTVNFKRITVILMGSILVYWSVFCGHQRHCVKSSGQNQFHIQLKTSS